MAEFKKHTMHSSNDHAKQKAAITYNAAADHFDEPALSFWSRFGSATVDRLALPIGANVLDVACGSGASALPAAIAVGPLGSVTGIDLAENLLSLGRKKAASSGLKHIAFRSGDMTSLGFADESFDAVICVFGIFFVADMEGLLTELWRMVKPGGKMAITTWGPDLFAPAYDIWREVVKLESPDLYTTVNPWDRITDSASVTNLFHSAGIPHVAVTAEYGTHPLRGPEDWWTIVMGSGFRWSVEKMGAESAARVRAENLRRIESGGIKEIVTNVIYAIATKE